jgi:hypothetical protein
MKARWPRRALAKWVAGCAVLLVALARPRAAALAEATLRLDHMWLVVTPGAPQRTALERVGFRFSTDVNRHDGQGTASIMIDLENGYLELIWPDDSVPVSPGLEVAKTKFLNKMRWRETGWSPIGVGFDRTSSTPATLPFDTWRVTADWMGAGRSIEMLTPRDMPTALSLFITPIPDDVPAEAQPNGVKRITGLTVFSTSAAQLPPSAAFITASGAAKIAVGKDWLMDITFDDGAAHQTRDLRPDLPLVVHF